MVLFIALKRLIWLLPGKQFAMCFDGFDDAIDCASCAFLSALMSVDHQPLIVRQRGNDVTGTF